MLAMKPCKQRIHRRALCGFRPKMGKPQYAGRDAAIAI